MPDPVTFFDHQEVAKRRSSWAMLGFAATVILTAASVSLFGGWASTLLVGSESGDSIPNLFRTAALVSGGITLSIIFISWAWRASALAAGPQAVMKSMGAWMIETDSQVPDERRVLNLVEEMSIASGVPIPDVYMMDSTSINACAVGMEIDKAAVAVTRGATVKLNRDELQGVIAHEFSHILHGDMALNTHMIAWLAGLFTISEIGRGIMAISESSSNSASRSRDRENGAAIILLVGAGLWALGAIGLLFGKLLQASVSRQREFLADASAVQYTRNPDGLGNALRKLGNKGLRGRMVRPPTDCGHMMFSNLRSRSYSGGFSTHPPLAERISRVLPIWDGSYLEPMELELSRSEPLAQTQKKSQSFNSEALIRKLPSTLILLNLLEEKKLPDTVRLQAVRDWKAQLDPSILEAVHQVEGAQKVIFDLLGSNSAVENKDRLGIVDLALPALRQMPETEKPSFLQKIKDLCNADGHIDLFEYCLQKILAQSLKAPGTQTTYQRMRVHIKEVETEVNVMLSCLSRLGSETAEEAAESFAQAEARMFGFTAGVKLQLLPAEACGLDALDRACEKLPGLAPNFQQRLLLAGLAAIAEDDHLHPDELQAFRAFAAVMRIPVPPGLGLVA